MLSALRRIEKEDPFFRARDWGRHASIGITKPEFQLEILKILHEPDTKYHLSSLLIEALSFATLTVEMEGGLQSLMLDEDRPYSIRSDIAVILIKAYNNSARDWNPQIKSLLNARTRDAYRLAFNMLVEIEFRGVSNKTVVEALKQYATDNSTTLRSTQKFTLRKLELPYSFHKSFPVERIAEVLDLIREFLRPLGSLEHHENGVDLKDLGIRLVNRAIRHEPIDAVRLWLWLSAFEGHDPYVDESVCKEIAEYFDEHLDLKHAIQEHVLFSSIDETHMWKSSWALQDVLPALAFLDEDACFFFNRISQTSIRDAQSISNWRFLVARLRGQKGFPRELWQTARKFAGNDASLIKLLEESKASIIYEWQEKQDARRKAETGKKLKRWTDDRRIYAENKESLKAGELKWTLAAAQVYLGLFSDLANEKQADQRLLNWLGPELAPFCFDGFEATIHRNDLPSAFDVAQGYAQESRWNVAFVIIVALVVRSEGNKGFADLTPEFLLLAAVILVHDAHLLRDISSEKTLSDILSALWATGYSKENFYRTVLEPQLIAKKTYVSGLHEVIGNIEHRDLAATLGLEWLDRFTELPDRVEADLIDWVCKWQGSSSLQAIYLERAEFGFVSSGSQRKWLGIQFLTVAEAANLDTLDYGCDPTFIWTIRDLFRTDRTLGSTVNRAEKLAWVVGAFRAHWPYVRHPQGVMSGDTNSWDATDFLLDVINELASQTDGVAYSALFGLTGYSDDYSSYILHAIAQQRKAKRESNFHGITFQALKAAVTQSQPSSNGDLQAYVLDLLEEIQEKTLGSDTDPSDKYYETTGGPMDELTCSQRIVEELRAAAKFDAIEFVPESRMPRRKDVDIGCCLGTLRLPIEVKGQWNKDLWTAASQQLDMLYTIDWRAGDRGIYLVLWFGSAVERNKKLKPPPKTFGLKPTTPEELKRMLIKTIPIDRRSSISVYVLDLTR
jgi:hypothetical protein